MSSLLIQWQEFPYAKVLSLLVIFVVALLVNRILRKVTDLLVKPAASQGRAAQIREQQTRTVAGVLYSAANKVVWVVALLAGLSVFNANVTAVAAFAGLTSVALGFGAQHLIRDVITGFYIVLEDQYVVGDTIQVGDIAGRVEHLTLRRTVVRDDRGALVTIANGDIRTVSNLSRDWSQAFVDVSLAPETPLEKTIQALESAASEMRGDPSWSQALLDGPRILGIEALGQTKSTVRMQVRTTPTRQDEVSRELRRRIQLEFQRKGLPVSQVQRVELANAPTSPRETAKAERAS